jgi:hypothetical protein
MVQPVRLLPPSTPVAALIARGFYFIGELADRWAEGRLDWRSILCRN